jgi:hypothetical protein
VTDQGDELTLVQLQVDILQGPELASIGIELNTYTAQFKIFDRHCFSPWI